MTPTEELSLLLRPAGGGLYLVSTGKGEQEALQRRWYGADDEAGVQRAFEDSLARIEGAKVVTLGVPSDTGAGFRRGANLGPQGIRARLLDDDAGFRAWCDDSGIVDIGDVFVVPQLLSDEMLGEDQLARARAALYPKLPDDERRALPVSPLSIAQRALSLVLALNPRVKPFVLGGDHSVAWPVVAAMHAAGRRFCIVQSDAHTDLLEERLGIRICFGTWTWHANELLGRQGRVIQVGIRATRRTKEHWEGTLGVRQLWADEVNADPERALDDIVAAAKATGLPCYLSNDIDGTDEAFADATGTPEPRGLTVDFLRALIKRLSDEVELCAADLVEVAPSLGHDGGAVTLQTAAAYARDTLAALVR